MNTLNSLDANVWLGDDRVLFLSEPEGIDREFRSRSRLSSRSPKVWADAYILAFASVAGFKLVTFDQALKSRGTEVLVLLKQALIPAPRLRPRKMTNIVMFAIMEA